MKEIKFLQPVEAILNKNFNTSDEFLPLEPNCLKYTGKFEESDRGDYEIVVIKKVVVSWFQNHLMESLIFLMLLVNLVGNSNSLILHY